MKRVLQAILIAGIKQKEDVLDGKKKITIREGHRGYTEGPVLIGCHILNWSTMKTITEVRYTTLGEVEIREMLDDGFKRRSYMLKGLQEFYPDLTMDSPVTVVRWN